MTSLQLGGSDVFSPVQISELVRISAVAVVAGTAGHPGGLPSTLYTVGPGARPGPLLWSQYADYHQTVGALARRTTPCLGDTAPALRCGHCADWHSASA